MCGADTGFVAMAVVHSLCRPPSIVFIDLDMVSMPVAFVYSDLRIDIFRRERSERQIEMQMAV